MGLDMYLTKRSDVKNWNFKEDDEKHSVSVKMGGKARKDIKPKRVCAIIEDIMYWRKANAIHSWFVQNTQDGVDECQESYVSKEQLEELASICEQVVKTKDSELLQPSGGFFFGSTDVDEYYFKEVKHTAEELRKVLAEEVPKGQFVSFYYRASW